MSLTREAIVSTALSIMDTYGLSDVTMRRIAASLHVQPGALYWHVESKQDLFAAMAQNILADLPEPASGDPMRLRLWAARFHSLLLSHHGGAELASSVLALSDWQDSPGHGVELSLLGSGFDQRTAYAAARGLTNLVIGHALDEEQRRQAERLCVKVPALTADSATALDDGVAIFVAGLHEVG